MYLTKHIVRNVRAIVTCAMAGVSLGIAHAGTCTIDVASNQQTIDGFGFSSAWSGTLTSAKNNALYNTLGMSLLRVRIAENGSWSSETANASAAHAAGAKVFGTPWSAPTNWTSNGKASGGTLLTSHYADYANWLHSAATSIGIDYVSVQNEPDYSSWMNWTPTQIFNFVKNNATAIGKPVVMPESFHFSDSYSDPVINDSTAVTHFTILGGHIYGGGDIVHTNALNHGKHVWMTEHYIDGASTNITDAMVLAKEITDCMHNNMSAYFWWWVNDNYEANLVNSSGTIFKNGYIIGQFAKWVRPGKSRCSATYNPSSGVYVTAYHNNGVVIVAINNGGSSASTTFNIQNASGVTSFDINRTSATESMLGKGSVAVANNTFTYTLAPNSVTTFHQTGF